MLTQNYLAILHLHIGCVILSGSLFFVRGVMRLAGMELANHRLLRFASYLIDTVLLTAAILLILIIRQYPLVNGWLSMKLVMLVLYIVLGSLALKRARNERTRQLAFAGALACYGFIVSVALTHQPLGFISRLIG